jgi:hypothetical protein
MMEDEAGPADENTYYFEEVEVDEEDDFANYKEVSDIDSDIDEEEEENFDSMFATLKIQENGPPVSPSATETKAKQKKAVTLQKPVVVDDFIRNFLIKNGMKKSLDSFQAEWYEMKESGRIKQEEDVSFLY